MERRIVYLKKVDNICSDAMSKIVAMMKKRNINVLNIEKSAESYGNAFAHFYDRYDALVEEPITAICINHEDDMLFYTTEFNVINELSGFDEEDVYTDEGDYDYNKLYDYDEVWCSFYDSDLTDVIDVYDIVYGILQEMEG